jgi:hypothetical protein
MSATVLGRLDWQLSRSDEGARTYDIEWLVEVTDPHDDGPETVSGATGLPVIGDPWVYGNDSDMWALCTPQFNAAPVVTGEPGKYWTVKQKFSTKALTRCQDQQIENPLLEPFRISGGFENMQEEAAEDAHGKALTSSSHEQYRGQGVEKDASRPNVLIGMNLAVLPLSLASNYLHSVNDDDLWGLPNKCIKFSNFRWSRKLYGTCSYYYTIDYEFDIKYDNWDKKVLDEGTKILKTGGDKNNPADFRAYKDEAGENTRTLLDGNGEVLTDIEFPYYHDFELYPEQNLLTLGIPNPLV